MYNLCVILLLLLVKVDAQIGVGLTTPAIPDSTKNWELLVSSNGIKFTPRNAHASCIFKNRMWVTGGKTDLYTMYNLQSSYKAADVWYSYDGIVWAQEENLEGDFWAQNDDVQQPGPVAPWYERFGHSLNTVDVDGDGEHDIMVLMGGYAPEPSHDIWVSEDGTTWIYCGLAQWSPRAWHSVTEYNNTLWLTGGSPLNNEVWRLEKVTVNKHRRAPLTRSMYANYSYEFEWVRITEHAAWSPRVGSSLLSHSYFNDTRGETVEDSVDYLVLIAGFGGVIDKESPQYDGFHGLSDVWRTTDGVNWTLATSKAAFGARGWHSAITVHGPDKRLAKFPGTNDQSGQIYLFGGGNIGFTKSSTQHIFSMDGRMDAYVSRDMVSWIQINYQEGGGTPEEIQRSYASKLLPAYSSQEWSRTIVDTSTKYLGLWGATLVSFNASTGKQYPGDLFLIAGDYTGSGARSNQIYQSRPGLYCDIKGVACNYAGTCGASGCECSLGFTGEHCELSVPVASARAFFASVWLSLMISISTTVILCM